MRTFTSRRSPWQPAKERDDGALRQGRPAGGSGRNARIRRIAAALCLSMLTAGAPHAAAGATLSFGALEGAQLRDTGSFLRHPDTPGAFGVDMMADAGEISAATLLSGGLAGVDLFLTGKSALAAPLGDAAIDALKSYVDKGGALIINGDRGAQEEFGRLLAGFGASLGTPSTSRAPLSILTTDHPVMSGPFGRVDWLSIGDAARFAFTDAGMGAAWQPLAAYPDGAAAIAVLAPDRKAGRLGLVVLLPDIECFLQFASGCGGLGAGDYRIALRNALAYGAAGRLAGEFEADFGTAAVPLPGGALLLAPLLGLGGIISARYRSP